MPLNSEQPISIARLSYKPGETIIKGGDFGISIYEIVEGKVEIYAVAGIEAANFRQEEKKPIDPWAEHRGFYRKAVSIECMYRQVADKRKTLLHGTIKDISKTGMRLEVPISNALTCGHEPDEDFFFSAVLPTGKRLDVNAKIVRHYTAVKKGTCELGLKFYHLSPYSSEVLGFFLMP